MPRPKRTLTESEKMHFDITKKTYCDAIQRGDKNVYFIDGEALMSLAGEDGTVDGIHPTDFGFYSMASAIIPVLKKALNIR